MKILFMRFSSIGDVTQSISIVGQIAQFKKEAQIHVLTKPEFKILFENHPQVATVWTLDTTTGFSGVWNLIKKLNQEKFSHLYDAHNNLRSNIFYFFVQAKHKLQKPMFRWKRFLLLKFHINLFEMPFSGQRDLLKPLEKWGIPFQLPPTPQLFLPSESLKKADQILQKYQLSQFITLVPSAAYPLKRWPIEYFEKLILSMPDQKFVVLAGHKDHFTEQLNHLKNCVNLTGQTDLITSAAIISRSLSIVANDTGLMHFAEQLGIPTVALMGPAPFGFPSREQTKILEIDLKCRPCSKHGQGPCTNSSFQKCLRDITPETVRDLLK